jgi:hypothetical protein
MMQRVSQFLRTAGAAPQLREEVGRSNCYRELATISTQVGEPCSPEELRAAFRARNAFVVACEMMRRGMMNRLLLNVPPLNEAIWSRITALDLTEIRDQMRNCRGWTAERAALGELRYRRFLYLKITLPEGKASPSEDVDEFWHQHIINTERYGPDCQQIAGRFLHHSFLSPEKSHDAQLLSECRLATCTSYEELFDEPYEETVGSALLSRWG